MKKLYREQHYENLTNELFDMIEETSPTVEELCTFDEVQEHCIFDEVQEICNLLFNDRTTKACFMMVLMGYLIAISLGIAISLDVVCAIFTMMVRMLWTSREMFMGAAQDKQEDVHVHRE